MKIKIFRPDFPYVQLMSTMSATFSMTAASTYLAWSSPSLPMITSDNSPIGVTVTKEEGSWIASSYYLGAIPGCIYAGWAVGKFGPKMSLLLSVFPLFFPWIAVIFAKSVLTLCIARFIAGSAFAIVTTSGSVYAGEIADKEIRGKLGTLFNISKLTGSLYVLAIGPFVSYTVLALCCCILPPIFAVLFYFMPESPYYLVKCGKREKARENLIKLASKKWEESKIDEKLKEVDRSIEYTERNKSTLWELVSKKRYRKSLIVIVGVKMIQQLTGISGIEAYMQTIIQGSGSSISPEISSIICGLVQVPAALLTATIVDKVGRKPLLIISCIGCGIALIGETAYFYLQNVQEADVAYLSWLPTTGLMLYLIMNPLGIFTLPYILLGELFAENIKGVAVSASTLFGVTLGFLVTKFFEPITETLGLHGMFGLYSCACFLGAFFVYFVQPETKGKTFIEIQGKLTRSKKNVAETPAV